MNTNRWQTIKHRLSCLLLGHKWDGYAQRPLPLITCQRCGFEP